MAEKEKKRKRPDTNGDKPHKKRATEAYIPSSSNIKVSYINANEELHPAIGTHPLRPPYTSINN